MVFDFGYDSRSGGETTGHPVTHSAELNFVFMRPGMQAEPRRVAEVVAQYWANFARSSDPNGEGLPLWPVSRGAIDGDSSGDVALRVRGAERVEVVRGLHAEQCEWWRVRWGAWEEDTCSVECFGGCIPCWEPRRDASSAGEIVGSC